MSQSCCSAAVDEPGEAAVWWQRAPQVNIFLPSYQLLQERWRRVETKPKEPTSNWCWKREVEQRMLWLFPWGSLLVMAGNSKSFPKPMKQENAVGQAIVRDLREGRGKKHWRRRKRKIKTILWLILTISFKINPRIFEAIATITSPCF